MISVRWHGRGGQGAFTAAKLLGAGFSLGENKYALAFPSFGPERRGAPVRAFTKLDNIPIQNRSEVKLCDYIVILDETLFDPSYLDDLNPGGRIIVDSKKDYQDERIVSVDALSIAEEELKAPITNTAMLGALLGVLNYIPEKFILEAVGKYMPEKITEKNKKAITRAMSAVKEKTE